MYDTGTVGLVTRNPVLIVRKKKKIFGCDAKKVKKGTTGNESVLGIATN
jgi:hypothetical protein